MVAIAVKLETKGQPVENVSEQTHTVLLSKPSPLRPRLLFPDPL